MSNDFYRDSLADLSDAMTLVFVDSRGSGKSTKPKTTQEYRYGQFANDLNEVRRGFGIEKVWVMGHSLGGVQALQFALDFPSAVNGLILVGTYAETDEAYAEDVRARKEKRRHESWYREIDWQSLQTDDALAQALDAALPLYFHDDAKRQSALPLFAKAHYSIHAWNGWKDSEQCAVHLLPRLSEIQCPVLLIVGTEDFVCSPMNSTRIHDRINRSRMTVIPNSGHFPWIESPEKVFPAIREFVNGTHTSA